MCRKRRLHETRGIKDTSLTTPEGINFIVQGSIHIVYNSLFFLIFFCDFLNASLAYLGKPIKPDSPYSEPSTDEYGL